MDPFVFIREVLDYIRRFRGKNILIKICNSVIADENKINNVIRDIILLKGVGIGVVIAHSKHDFDRGVWSGIEPVTFLDISTMANIGGHMEIGITPVVFFDEDPSLSSDKAVASLAVKLSVIKIIYVTNYDGIFQSGKSLIHDLDIEQAKAILASGEVVSREMEEILDVSLMVCGQGVSRIHIIGSRSGSLLKELLTCDGSGTMIYDTMYQEVRKAKEADVAGIFEIIKDSIKTTSITLESIKKNIGNFFVFAVDQQIRGCIMAKEASVGEALEIAYLSILPAYENPAIFKRLIAHVVEGADSKFKYIFFDPEKNTNLLGIYPWFKDMGFEKRFLPKFGSSPVANRKKAWVKH